MLNLPSVLTVVILYGKLESMVKKRLVRKKVRKKSRNTRPNRKYVLELSEGVLSTTVDVALLLLFLNIEFGFGGKPGPGGVWRAYHKAGEDWEKINYDSIKRALYRLKKKGLIKTIGWGDKVTRQITKQGKKRLEAIVPSYDEKRAWDKKLYLVTYDVPEHQREDRDLLRRYLKKIGCGMFQKSVWLTPYNPTGVLRDFVSDKNLSGAVVVSCIGKDGDIGQEDIEDVVARVFQLDELNDRYKDYLREFGEEEEFSKSQAVFGFFSILGDDPQLPFELLPNGWVGSDAYDLFKEICSE